MKKMLAMLMILAIFSGILAFGVCADEVPATPAPTSTEEPGGLVLDASIVFAIFGLAAALGVGAGYWYARKR